jgi:hypothetical protein
MEAMRRFLAIVLADARQRWRAPRFGLWLLVFVATTWFCFPPADAGYRILGIGHYRVAYSSAWVGMVVAMLMCWLSLLGFYLVRGTLTRDIESRCWQLLVATPLSRTGFLLAKWVSHLLVLGAIATGMLVVAAIAVFVRVPSADVDVWQLALPMLLLGLPVLGICALCAVLFDLVPMLRRTLGNSLYVVLWVCMLASASVAGRYAGHSAINIGDVHGIAVFKRHLAGVSAAQGLDTRAEGICLFCGSGASARVPIRWTQWSPTRADLLGRLFWLLLPLPALALAALGLDRAAAAATTGTRTHAGPRRLRWLQTLLSPLQHRSGSALVSLELQHALRERPLLAWGAMLLAWGLQLFATPAIASLAVIGAWAVFLPVFSRSALREREFATAAIVFSSASAISRLFRVRCAVLLLLGMACTAPALIRFAMVDAMLAVTVLVLVLSIATWSLCLGALTGSSRPFELLFVLGALLALNGVGALDAAIAPMRTLLTHIALLPLALLLLAFAWPRLSRAHGNT